MKKKKVTITGEEGNVIKEIPMTLADGDWLRAELLAEKARAGDQQAAEKLKRMQETDFFEVEAKE